MLTAAREEQVDYQATAQLATEAFGSPSVHFSPEHLRWFYERSFSRGSVVVALRCRDRKVGQFAIVNQSVQMNGVAERAAQLVDLFVLQQFRSRGHLQMLYDEVERQCRALNIRFAIGMPNAQAAGVNEHFFQLKPHLWLQERAGLAMPAGPTHGVESMVFDPACKTDLIARLSHYATAPVDNGLQWDGEKLYDRLCGFKFRYGLHMTDRALLISSPRLWRGLRYTLLCGFLSKASVTLSRAEVRGLVGAACRTWRRPLFVYAGFNKSLAAMPGLPIPKRLRPSLMLMQLRDFTPEKSQVTFDRYQLIDFDFA